MIRKHYAVGINPLAAKIQLGKEFYQNLARQELLNEGLGEY